MTAAQWKDFTSSGGTISNDGKIWWPTKAAMEGEQYLKELKKKKEKVTAEDYLPARDYMRPYMVYLINCKNVLLRDVATMKIDANDITLENLTIENSYGFDNKTSHVVACKTDTISHKKTIPFTGHQMALRTMNNTRLKAINVHFKSFAGDTVSPWNVKSGMFYFKDCVMEGGVDFYCPRGWAYAEDCKFYANTGPASIWHDGSVNEDSKTVLKDCPFDGYKNFDLGRYHKDAQFYLIDCDFSKYMADKDIYLVPTINIINWGRRVYYYNCHRDDGGDYAWFKNNLSSAKGSPSEDEINAKWVFGKRWDPLKSNNETTN